MHGNQRIGAFFERLVIASLQTTQYEVSHNQSINFPSAVRVKMNKGLPGSVKPDGVTERLGADSDGRTFIAPAFYEAKATSSSMTKKTEKDK